MAATFQRTSSALEENLHKELWEGVEGDMGELDEEACYCETDDECEEYTITLGTMHDAENKENANSGDEEERDRKG